MLKRTLCIESPCFLRFEKKQLCLENRETGELKTLPLEDLGVLLIDNPQVTLTGVIIRELARANVALVVCDERHLPSALFQGLEGNQLLTERQRQQVAASEPLKKNLWKQTVEQKIRNQAALLSEKEKNGGYLLAFSREVRSGDPENREAQASRIYWKELFGPAFLREREGLPPNNLLNYGYAILRAATARALVSSGLHPAFGIHHRNKYNPWCLADDLMEPYRPFVDAAVYGLVHSRSDFHVLDTATKAALLQVLSCDVRFKQLRRPLSIGLSLSTASLAGCFAGKQKSLNYPSFL